MTDRAGGEVTIRRGTARRLGLRPPTARQWDIPLSDQSWFPHSWRPAPGYERAHILRATGEQRPWLWSGRA